MVSIDYIGFGYIPKPNKFPIEAKWNNLQYQYEAYSSLNSQLTCLESMYSHIQAPNNLNI